MPDAKHSLKELAVAFLHECAGGRAAAAFAERATSGFKHHNVWFPADGKSLAEGMDANHRNFPNKAFEIQRALEDGDLVAVHSRVVLQPGTEVAVVHILRFEGRKVAEMWDVGLPVPQDSSNKLGAF